MLSGSWIERTLEKGRGSVRDRFQAWMLLFLISGSVVSVVACNSDRNPVEPPPSPQLIASGKQIFRFDTFGDEKFWTDTLHMERVIQAAVDPTTALSVGLKVDMDTLPAALVQAIQAGQVDLKSPATTVALIKLGAVVGCVAD